MKFVINDLRDDGGDPLEVDFASYQTRLLLKSLSACPTLLKVLCRQLHAYEQAGGMSGQPDVQVSPEVADYLRQINERKP